MWPMRADAILFIFDVVLPKEVVAFQVPSRRKPMYVSLIAVAINLVVLLPIEFESCLLVAVGRSPRARTVLAELFGSIDFV